MPPAADRTFLGKVYAFPLLATMSLIQKRRGKSILHNGSHLSRCNEQEIGLTLSLVNHFDFSNKIKHKAIAGKLLTASVFSPYTCIVNYILFFFAYCNEALFSVVPVRAVVPAVNYIDIIVIW